MVHVYMHKYNWQFQCALSDQFQECLQFAGSTFYCVPCGVEFALALVFSWSLRCWSQFGLSLSCWNPKKKENYLNQS